MKKKIKWILGSLLAVAAAAAGIWYCMQPAEAQSAWSVKGDLTESLRIEGTVTPGHSSLLTAPVPGKVEEICFGEGNAVQEGQELVKLDDSRYQQQLTDQIASLEKQKSAVYTQGNSSQSEIKLRQEQLIGQMEAARQQYDLLFGDGGSASLGVETAFSQLEAAKASYEDALAANREAEDAWRQEEGLDAENSPLQMPYTEAQLQSLASAVDAAQAAYENAKLQGSDTNKRYYKSLMESYEAQFETLTENGNNGAQTILTTAAQLQLSIDALKREQKQDPVTAPFAGVVWEVLVEEGAYVSQGQALLSLYEEGEKKLEVWLLTEDAIRFEEGDPVQVELADGTVLDGRIAFLSPVAQERLSSLGIAENRCLVEVEAEGIPERMGAGYQAELQFSYSLAEEAVYVPISALAEEENGTCVYLYEDGRARAVQVETGVYCGGYAQIQSGLEEGEQVLLNPGEQGIRDGSRVRLSDEQPDG